MFLGEIPDLFPDEEVENIISNMRNEVKTHGLMDTRDACWKFFIDRVRRQLKVGHALFCCVMFLKMIFIKCISPTNEVLLLQSMLYLGGGGERKRDICILDNSRIITTLLCKKNNRD